MARLNLILCVLLGLCVAGCFSYPPNARLGHFDPHAGYRFDLYPATTKNTDDVFIVLCFSGGGNRSAAFSYGVLESFHDTPIAGGKSLLDEADIISSASGGSFTAAYYALFGNRIFQDYKQRFLYKDMQASLIYAALSPYNWLRLCSPWFGRVELSSEYLDQNVFMHKTYADILARHTRPFVVLNSTDMSIGKRLEFTQDQFDALYSDLSKFPIGRAVAASSAFPVALSPLTLNNYCRGPDYADPRWLKDAADESNRTDDPRRFETAQNFMSYSDHKNRAYIHLLDGGIADNLGVRGPLAGIMAVQINDLINSGKIKKLVFVVVNSASNPYTDRDRHARTPGVVDVIETVASVPIDNFTADSVAAVHDYITQLKQSKTIYKARAATNPSSPYSPLMDMDFYEIQVNFDSLKDKSF